MCRVQTTEGRILASHLTTITTHAKYLEGWIRELESLEERPPKSASSDLELDKERKGLSANVKLDSAEA
jgi:hypothetical protein